MASHPSLYQSVTSELKSGPKLEYQWLIEGWRQTSKLNLGSLSLNNLLKTGRCPVVYRQTDYTLGDQWDGFYGQFLNTGQHQGVFLGTSGRVHRQKMKKWAFVVDSKTRKHGHKMPKGLFGNNKHVGQQTRHLHQQKCYFPSMLKIMGSPVLNMVTFRPMEPYLMDCISSISADFYLKK